LVAFRRPATKFVGVILPRSVELIGSYPNLTLRSNIREPELLDVYRAAALMAMPLHDPVANNAILESLACGLPLVVTDVGATREYVSQDSAVFTRPNDSRGMAEAVLNLLDAPSERQKMSERAREQALKFSWPRVVRQLALVYAAVA
jgi:glycosyltransferase involved in cell wall biosynthesis